VARLELECLAVRIVGTPQVGGSLFAELTELDPCGRPGAGVLASVAGLRLERGELVRQGGQAPAQRLLGEQLCDWGAALAQQQLAFFATTKAIDEQAAGLALQRAAQRFVLDQPALRGELFDQVLPRLGAHARRRRGQHRRVQAGVGGPQLAAVVEQAGRVVGMLDLFREVGEVDRIGALASCDELGDRLREILDAHRWSSLRPACGIETSAR